MSDISLYACGYILIQVHVNTDHLDFLTPESEGESAYLEGEAPAQFGSLWELERCAGQGFTQGIVILDPKTWTEDRGDLVMRVMLKV